jgi:HlyD family secretion protein
MNSVFAWFAGLLALIPGLGAAPPSGFTGYVEAKYVYVAPVTAGPIESLPVKEGQQIAAGAPLFVLTHSQQEALLAAAVAQQAAAEATWKNLATGGRPEELAAGEAAVSKAAADLKLAQTTLDRSQKLFSSAVNTQAQLDQDRANVASAEAALNQATSQLAVLGLPARFEQQQAAKASLDAARANVDKARADLADRSVVAPVGGRIERIYYDQGEVAGAGVPVLSILPANALKVEFYVGEADRVALQLGETVRIACDGCAADLAATVTFLASDPQYTSPIIYSRDERHQLTYLAEATLGEAGNLLPGQPVSVSLSK